MSESGIPVSPPEIHEFRQYPVYVVQPSRPRYWLHLLLLLLTLLTTTIVGAQLQANFDHNVPVLRPGDTYLPLFPFEWLVRDPHAILRGIPFSLTLMLILFAHEMGHYICARRYHVSATLPFFIPAPTLIGTLGAFIRIKSYIPTREALFDIGIAGPIAGFIFAVPAMFAGLLLSRPGVHLVGDDIALGYPAIFHLGRLALPHAAAAFTHPLSSLNPHPIAIAAWVGMFATALNLLPGGQLDGGHIIYAAFPRAHKWVSMLTIVALIPLSFFGWLGWLLWAAILGVTGLRHPNVPSHPGLSAGRRALALFAIFMLCLTLVPSPFPGNSLRELMGIKTVHVPFLPR
ncbi:MAG: site-2 protease family protein [Terriglobia bacterium]|jgi:membrane-associated protease RseP (regulator of RpoE activity)|nr:site-2 protease family protein [Terriglobia bacterium]